MTGLMRFSFVFSMYLMMDHNMNKYYKFLKILRCSKIYWICCCGNCGDIVTEQLLYIKAIIGNVDSDQTGNNRLNNVESNSVTQPEKTMLKDLVTISLGKQNYGKDQRIRLITHQK